MGEADLNHKSTIKGLGATITSLDEELDSLTQDYDDQEVTIARLRAELLKARETVVVEKVEPEPVPCGETRDAPG